MVGGFKVGKYYRWIGPPVGVEMRYWASTYMDKIRDGKPHKCTDISDRHEYFVGFEGVPSFGIKTRSNPAGHWDWGQVLEYFEEVNSQPLLPGLE
jgi:hypothetical protein